MVITSKPIEDNIRFWVEDPEDGEDGGVPLRYLAEVREVPYTFKWEASLIVDPHPHDGVGGFSAGNEMFRSEMMSRSQAIKTLNLHLEEAGFAERWQQDQSGYWGNDKGYVKTV